jgi:DNA mismatch repair protein MutS
VIDRAKTILAKLESDDTSVSLPAATPQAKPKKKIAVARTGDAQLSLLEKLREGLTPRLLLARQRR